MGSKQVPVWRAHVDADGRFGWLESEKGARLAYVRGLAGKELGVRIEEWRDARSIQANNYYWGCVLTPMSESGSAGDQSPEEIHDAMCARFLPDEHKRVAFFNAMTGDRLEVEIDTRRSSKLKGDEFYDFVEKVRKFALEFMGVVTEDPDPLYWRKRSAA